jgi:O-antigen/teichoic acid export membrane protein
MGALPSESWYPDFNRDKLKSIAGYSAALTVPQLIQSTIYALGSILVNKYFGLSALGRYRAAYDIANRVWFFSNGMSLVVFPKFSRILSEAVARERFLPRITAYLDVSWAGYNLLSIIGILLASKLLGFMGLTHRDTVDLFVLLILGASLFAHATLSNEFLQAAGKYRIITILNTLALLVMGSSFFILYKQTAILSMGWAWICSQAIYASVSDVMTIYISSFPCKVQFNLLMSKLVILTCSLAAVAVHFRVLPTVIQFVSLTIVLLCTGWSIYRLWPALRHESNGNSV